MSKRPKFLFSMITVVVLVSATLLLAVINQFSSFVGERVEGNIDRAGLKLDSRLETEKNASSLTTLFLAQDSQVIEALEEEDLLLLGQRLDELSPDLGGDVYTVVDLEGSVLFSSMGNTAYGDDLSGHPIVQSTLSGNHPSSLERVGSRDLQVVSGKAIYDGTGQKMGAVFAGTHIGHTVFLNDLLRIASSDFTLFMDGKCIESTLKTLSSEKNICEDLESDLPLFEGSDTIEGIFKISGYDFLGIRQPLKNLEGDVIGTMLIGQFLVEKQSAISGFITMGIVVATSILSISSLFIYLRAKSFNKSLDELEYQKIVAEERVRLMLDATPLGCHLWDENFNMIDCNEAAYKPFGITSKEEYFQKFASCSPKKQPDGMDSHTKCRHLISQTFKKGSLTCDWAFLLPDGSILPTEVIYVRINYGTKCLVAAYIRDVREWQSLMKKIDNRDRLLRKTNTLLEDALQNALSSSRAKSDFLSVMSHEMRTPLNVISGMTMIAKKETCPDSKNLALDKVENASQHLLGIINNILEMAKIEANKMELVEAEFNLREMLKNVISLVGFRMSEKGHDFIAEIDDRLPYHCYGDQQRLVQVLVNLLANAATYTPSGGEVRFIVKCLSKDEFSSELLFSVRDNGIGISSDQQGRLFKMFEQLDNSSNREYGGAGLGLAISRKLLRLMGGSRIFVESELGEGSTFSFTLKLDYSFDSDLELDAKAERENSLPQDPLLDDAATDLSDKKILLAEDVEVNSEILISLLSDTGVEIDVAINGEEALDMVRKKPEYYDLVLMDIQMPKMDGIEATRRIRSLPCRDRDIPIIALTANVFTEDIETYIAAGMDDHLSKPIDHVTVLSTLKKYL